jgi:effector-binding domain-containing protein
MMCMKPLYFVFLLLITSTVMSTEEPKFKLVDAQDNFQLRIYQPMLLAQVEVGGDMKQASSMGFSLLADYIFGNNIIPKGGEPSTNMSQANSQKIKMTAPVSRVATQNKQWVVNFVMPAEWTKQTLPIPNNNQVKIVEVPSEMVAVVQFSGLGREKQFKQQQARLMTWLNANNLTAIGSPRYAAYNPPWTLPPFRRNEVLIPVIATE